MGQSKERDETPSMPAPGHSGSFRLNLTIGELSDPRAGLEDLRNATAALKLQLDHHESTNKRLDSFVQELERKRRP